jgi:hypothetical protein
MTAITKVVLIAAITAVGIASPAFAQAASPNQPIAARHGGHAKMVGRRSGARIFDMVAPTSPYDPALSGGGSLGYNQNLHDDAW